MPVVRFLFRKPTENFFSIEKVFNQLAEKISGSFNVVKSFVPFYSSSPKNILLNIRYARRQRADVYHITGDIHYLVLAYPRNRTILTIHDCVFMQNATGLKRRILKWLFLDMPVRHCRLVTTISEATRNDILKYTGCSPDKVVVIPNPIDDIIRYEPATFNMENPSILFLGSTPNKNLERAIRALRGIPCTLTIIGEIPAQAALLLEEQQVRFTQQSRLSAARLADAYVKADMVLFPSTFEGFGLPIVEGQKAGRPVITSNLSPMKEVAGAGACLVDPYDVESIRAGVLSVIQNEAYRRQLIQEGLGNVQRYETSAIANLYTSYYQRILSN